MSRPCASVPNQNSRPGGSSATIRLASITGSVCAIHGASTPAATASRKREPPMMRLARSFIPFTPSGVLDARVDQPACDIDQRVDDQGEQDDCKDAALHGRNVALEHVVDQHGTKP